MRDHIRIIRLADGQDATILVEGGKVTRVHVDPVDLQAIADDLFERNGSHTSDIGEWFITPTDDAA